jgi:hypothetical protein
MGSETSDTYDGIRELLSELELNSEISFQAPPNAEIRARILEFLIPGPIPCIQTRCKHAEGVTQPTSNIGRELKNNVVDVKVNRFV